MNSTLGSTPAHAATPSTAGGRYIHALLRHDLATRTAEPEAAPRGSSVAPKALAAGQQIQLARAHGLTPPTLQSISVHSVTSSRR